MATTLILSNSAQALNGENMSLTLSLEGTSSDAMMRSHQDILCFHNTFGVTACCTIFDVGIVLYSAVPGNSSTHA